MKALVYTLLLVFFISTASFGQIKRADREYERFNYAIAIELYEKYIDRNEVTLPVAENLANSYRMINDYENAADWYSRVVEYERVKPVNYLYYGNVLKNLGSYLDAIDQYVIYGDLVPEEGEKARALAASCYKALEWTTYPEQVQLKNISSLNTEFSEFSPVINNGKMYFTSDRPIEGKDYDMGDIHGWTGKPYLQVFETEIDSGYSWKEPEPFNSMINTTYHSGPVTFSEDGNTVFFTRTRKVKNPKRLLDDEEQLEEYGFVNRLEIWYSEKVREGVYTMPKPFEHNDIANYSVGHPVLSPDEEYLYFVSDMEGGVGETDIWYCEWDGENGFGDPVNAGPTLNSSGKEMFPSFKEDGTLYFSSNGNMGLGGLDLYYSVGSGDEWSKPVNLKYPMNSPQDDFGLVYDSTGTSGYFASDRDKSTGDDDIFWFNEPTCILAGVTLTRDESGAEQVLEDVLVELYKKGDTTEVISYKRTSNNEVEEVCLRAYEPCKIVANAEGHFFFKLQAGEEYELKASKPGYFTQRAEVRADCEMPGDTTTVAMLLNKIETGRPIVIKDLFFEEDDEFYVKQNIYYDLDRANIRYDAALELNKLVQLLKDNSDLKVELGAHTDCRHSEEYNLDLSQRRAEAAVQYMVDKGVDPDMITARGYGESQLLNGCTDDANCTEAEHQANRRAEIKVLEVIPQTVYEVKPGDTLYNIARQHNTTVQKLKQLNDMETNRIFVGDQLQVKEEAN